MIFLCSMTSNTSLIPALGHNKHEWLSVNPSSVQGQMPQLCPASGHRCFSLALGVVESVLILCSPQGVS